MPYNKVHSCMHEGREEIAERRLVQLNLIMGEGGGDTSCAMILNTAPYTQYSKNQVTYNIAFMRHFIFIPTKGQEGTRYDVCFQGYAHTHSKIHVRTQIFRDVISPLRAVLPHTRICTQGMRARTHTHTKTC